MKISIFGLGYVGSVLSACLANQGHKVIGVDTNPLKINSINNGESPIVEPDLKEFIAKAVAAGSLRATHNVYEAITSTDLSFICVGTPSKKNNSLDLQYIEAICKDIGHSLKEKTKHHILVFRSTIFPGTLENVALPLLEKYSDKRDGIDFSIGISPEFLKEGSAIYDYHNPPINVLGTKHQCVRDVISEINNLSTDMPTLFLDIKETEMLKYINNVWHALKVGFANEIGNVCKALGLDSHRIMDVFCKDTKLNISSYYLKPGFAFGGSCLPKDLRAFIYESQNLDLNLPIINSILPSNRLQIESLIERIAEDVNKRIGVLGISFKANTDDLRESPMIELVERLIGKGYELTLFDHNIVESRLYGTNREYLLNHIPHISELMVSSIEELLSRVQTVIIGTNSAEFSHVADMASPEHKIIDLVRICSPLPEIPNYSGICW
ncbi:nucleotide sugar dehydrogenase [Legionella saoudiensis]|uniref:nucleotide sugar dehydrogenase n=1 Tax=Legionella saoudiensis TaxID=1750561 RepID=UPI000730CDAB|nr:UDP-glucose/GDP-mannose dehydrogenase family protein [Legionella saoudiensis]